ncbi:hypothetical protein [Kitasatospora sp. NPDC096204]|uniref:hypothetical protein n=1 Tax=Kitasatospora sp. NPDC096204 TaxID=3364094 RepID=UPI00380641E2
MVASVSCRSPSDRVTGTRWSLGVCPVRGERTSGIPAGDPRREELVDLLTDQLVRHTRAEEEHDRLVGRLTEEATRHAGDEEARLFPAVRAVTTEAEPHALAVRARETEESSTGRPRHRPPTERPTDRLPPPERSVVERMRDYLLPGGPH